MGERLQVSIEVSDDQLERIARRAAEIVFATAQSREADHGYLSVAEAAELMRCRPQRIYDLLSQRRLKRVKEGRRTLLLRSELEAYLRDEPAGSRTAPSRQRAA